MEHTVKTGKKFQIGAILTGIIFILLYITVKIPDCHHQIFKGGQFAQPSPKYQTSVKSNKSDVASGTGSNSEILRSNKSDDLRRTGSNGGFLCGSVKGNFGNRLFVFASIYGIAKMKNITYFIPKHDSLYSVFNLFNDSSLIVSKDSRKCKGTFFRKERKCCAYDPKLLNFETNAGYTLITYLQSWKYFEGAKKNLRKQLIFKTDIQLWVNHTLESISKEQNYSEYDDVTYIGVHVRRGDMMTSVSAYGYQVATPEYLHRAINRFIHLPNVIYIVCSLEIQWVKKQLKNITNVYYSDPKHGAHKDLALLAACDHVITTVGTFGWWGAWLSGGNVTYFKWPAKPGSGLRKQFSKDYTDFFPPEWTGI